MVAKKVIEELLLYHNRTLEDLDKTVAKNPEAYDNYPFRYGYLEQAYKSLLDSLNSMVNY